jgi:hypothetical protein
VWIVAVALAITAVTIVDGNLLVSLLVGGAVAGVVAAIGTVALGRGAAPRR